MSAVANCFERMKYGAFMGCTMGCALGLVFGGTSALRFGMRGSEAITQIGKAMAMSAGTFGTFMTVGTVIRSC